MDYLQDQRGLTLIEVIVAMVLILILVTAFTGALTTSLQREVEVDHSLKATDLAAGIIEYMGEDGNRSIVIDIYDDYGEQNDYGEQQIYLNDSHFTDEFDDSEIDDLKFASLREDESSISVDEYDGNPDLYRVTVDIYWDEPGVDDRSESITSLIFAPDTDDDED